MSSTSIEFLDPNNWNTLLADNHEHRVYLDNTGELYAVIDKEDYQWAVQWRWCAKRDPNGKVYARRAVGENANGQRLRTRTIYLHIEIMKRAKKRKRFPQQCLVDHRNGRSLDCRRVNLRWASYQQNNWNLFGRAYRQMSLDI